MNERLITIGIMTYNRKEIITEHVNYLLKLNLPTFVNVLIIDNNSSDGSYDAVRLLVEGNNNFKLLKNKENVGMAKSFIRLFDEADSEYLVLTSDEDFVLMEQMITLKYFIANNRPSFISPQIFINTKDRLYRGREDISLVDISEAGEASGYISGTVYKISECRDVLKSVDEVIHTNEYAYLYPQVLLTTLLLARGVGYFYNKPLTEKRYEAFSNITTLNNSGKYWDYGMRRIQYIGYLSFLEVMSDREKNIHVQKNLLRSIMNLKKSLENSVSLWILVSNPELTTIFESKKDIRKYFYIIKRICYLIILNPNNMMKKIGKTFRIINFKKIYNK